MSLNPPVLRPGMTKEGARWAYRLMEREASGELLHPISRTSWREVLGYAHDADAKAALEARRANERAAA